MRCQVKLKMLGKQRYLLGTNHLISTSGLTRTRLSNLVWAPQHWIWGSTIQDAGAMIELNLVQPVALGVVQLISGVR
jgi:hypothetical protein